jgi:hypothetical protein
MKGGYLMLVPQMADGFLATISERPAVAWGGRDGEWKNEQWSDVLEYFDSPDKSLWKLTRGVMRVPTPPLPCLTLEDWRYPIPSRQSLWPTALSLSFSW